LSKNVNLKLAVYGEGAVGKTSLVNLFFGKEVPKNYSPTLNSKISKKDYLLKNAGVTFKLNIWDVGGNRAVNPSINNAFFSDVDLALLVFDLTRPDLTLKNHKKNFLDRLNRYSEEPLTLIVGNKLDKLDLNKEFREAIQNHLGDKKSFIIASATSELNVINCFELLIYTFLKKSEILLPDLVPENSSSEFIEIIGKTEEELRGQLVNLGSIALKHRDLKPKIKVVDTPSKKEDEETQYFEFIQQELQKISSHKIILADKFLENITEVGSKISQLKKQNIKSPTELVDQLKLALERSKKDCEQKIEALTKLIREENELLIISSKSKTPKLGSLSEKEPVTFQMKKATPDLSSKVTTLPADAKLSIKPQVKRPILKVKVKAKPKQELPIVKDLPQPVLEKKSEIKLDEKPKAKPSKPKLTKVKIASKPIKKDPKIELYNRYERLKPGKRAVYRGKETKGFLEWKKENS
jgi:small GTP-binding protein